LAETIKFSREEHHFYAIPEAELDATKLEFPLSVSLQVTRDCDLKCSYCSEVGAMPNPSITTIKKMISNLRGVKRIILTGGEPLMRDDIAEIAEYLRELRFETVSLATNGVLMKPDLAQSLKSLVDYVDVTIDGPRKIHNRIRGKYDEIVEGIRVLHNTGINFSIVTVLYQVNSDSILYTCQIADSLGAKKLKIMPPIPKGRGKSLISKTLSSNDLWNMFLKIRSEKKRNGWKPRITLTDWNRIGEGHAILVHPNGDVVVSPVPSNEACIEMVGNILEEDIKSIWKKYRYKENHLKKYLEKTLYVC